MLVPKYWAESTFRGSLPRRRKVIHRFGWSDDSQAAAQAHAEQRVREAIERLENPESQVPWQEGQCRYGDEVRPICEEIIERRDPDVVTRNSYGALCLNTPDVLFADVDCHFPEPPWSPPPLPFLFVTLAIILVLKALDAPIYVMALVLFLPFLLALLGLIGVLRRKINGSNHEAAVVAIRASLLAKLEQILGTTVPGRFRLYATPNGFRIAAEHALFDPVGVETKQLFNELGTDRHFVFLCKVQRCFRARVSAKPWRCSVTALGRGQRVDWLGVRGQSQEKRQAWLDRYASASSAFAACRLIGVFGTAPAHPRALCVLDWHDELARAQSSLPLA